MERKQEPNQKRQRPKDETMNKNGNKYVNSTASEVMQLNQIKNPINLTKKGCDWLKWNHVRADKSERQSLL